MINWKKEGYIVGEEVCLVLKYYSGKVEFLTGKVTHVGTKILKVLKGGNRELKFVDGNSVSGVLWGDIYYVYKTKEEYEKLVLKSEKTEELRKKITEKIGELELEDLVAINNFLKNMEEQNIKDCFSCRESMVNDEDKLVCGLTGKVVRDEDTCKDFN